MIWQAVVELLIALVICSCVYIVGVNLFSGRFDDIDCRDTKPRRRFPK